MGVDAIGVYVKKTSDGVLLAMPKADLADATDFYEKKGKDGLPSLQSYGKWSYEQILQLNLLNGDGSVSDCKVQKLEDVIKACAGKCFVYIVNMAQADGEAIYELAKAHSAYSSFAVTPVRTSVTKMITSALSIANCA